MFLGKVQQLLEGAENFYEEVFAHLKMPHQPVRWAPDRQAALPGVTGQRAEAIKEAAVIQLINAYRVRGHLIADLDPLGVEPSYHPELDPSTYGLTIWDLDREFLTGSLGEAIGEGAPQPVATLREILETLRRAYCGSRMMPCPSEPCRSASAISAATVDASSSGIPSRHNAARIKPRSRSTPTREDASFMVMNDLPTC